MRKTNTILISDAIQNILDGIEVRLGGLVMLGLDPFSLEYSPYRLSNIKVRRIRWKINDVKPILLLFLSLGFDLLAFVEARIIKYEDSAFLKAIDDAVNVFDKTVGVYAVSCGEAMIFGHRCWLQEIGVSVPGSALQVDFASC